MNPRFHIAALLVAGLAPTACTQTETTTATAPAAQPAPVTTTAAARTDSFAERGPGIEKFYRIRTPGTAKLANDGSLYVRDWPDGVWQLYRVTPAADGAVAAGAGRPAQKLTNFKDGLTTYSLSHDGSKLLAMTAMGGNEKTQVYLLDQKNTDPATNLKPVLENPEVVHRVHLWTYADDGIVYTANDTDQINFHMYRYDFATGQSTKLLAKEGDWNASDITKDGSRLLVEQGRSASDSDLHELDVATGQLKLLNQFVATGGQTVAISGVGYMPDEQGVLFLSDHEQGMQKLFLLDPATGTVTKPLPALDRFELDGAGVDHDRTLLAVSTNEDGYSVPRLYRLPNFETVPLPEMEKGLAGLSDLEANRLIYSMSNARTPGLAFAYDIPKPGEPAGKSRQLTYADTQGIDTSKFALPKLIKYKTQDGTEVPAFLHLPANYAKGTPLPFVISYHGGPESQARPGWSVQTQYLVSEGFGVLEPNVRGSTGYGRAYHMADDYKGRWTAAVDGWFAAQWLVDSGYAMPGRIASYGGSYGGFMTTAVNIEDQERLERGQSKQRLFGACVDVVGVINFKTFLERTSGYRRKLREVEYGPLTDPVYLDSISPLVRADKINVPVLIAHGLNDPRVPVSEAMLLAESLMRRGLDPQQVYFDDEGHGFAKLDNRLLFARRMSKFLKETIGK